ncbi:hypothetical protein Scep_001600 [Stephania cephalantha]|uniref:Uncharacterized protein n=1 Tax=Stephania cephalantha TaxID=152367 RepID=A0AAP0LCA7_9MAGN
MEIEENLIYRLTVFVIWRLRADSARLDRIASDWIRPGGTAVLDTVDLLGASYRVKGYPQIAVGGCRHADDIGPAGPAPWGFMGITLTIRGEAPPLQLRTHQRLSDLLSLFHRLTHLQSNLFFDTLTSRLSSNLAALCLRFYDNHENPLCVVSPKSKPLIFNSVSRVKEDDEQRQYCNKSVRADWILVSELVFVVVQRHNCNKLVCADGIPDNDRRQSIAIQRQISYSSLMHRFPLYSMCRGPLKMLMLKGCNKSNTLKQQELALRNSNTLKQQQIPLEISNTMKQLPFQTPNTMKQQLPLQTSYTLNQ